MRSAALRTMAQHPDRVDLGLEPATTKETKCVENGVYTRGPTSERPNGHSSNGDADRDLRIQASYVVGCDGANSTVRRMQEFTITDLDFENDWLIIDIVSSNPASSPVHY